jgi:hypothetical protein
MQLVANVYLYQRYSFVVGHLQNIKIKIVTIGIRFFSISQEASAITETLLHFIYPAQNSGQAPVYTVVFLLNFVLMKIFHRTG